MQYTRLSIPAHKLAYKAALFNYLKGGQGVFHFSHPLAVLSFEQKTFASFYDRYAPKLWGLIVLAKLPARQSEAMLSNTLMKAWQSPNHHSLTEQKMLRRLLALAGEEGLPPADRQAIFPAK